MAGGLLYPRANVTRLAPLRVVRLRAAQRALSGGRPKGAERRRKKPELGEIPYMSMPAVSMRELLEAGVHFGHQTRRWHPSMKPFIYGERNGVHIINLQHTLPRFREALEFHQLSQTLGRCEAEIALDEGRVDAGLVGFDDGVQASNARLA